jgi:hypothetical protein
VKKRTVSFGSNVAVGVMTEKGCGWKASRASGLTQCVPLWQSPAMSFPLSIEGHFQIARGDSQGELCMQVLERAKGALWEVSDHVAVRDEQVVSRRGLPRFFLPAGGHPLAFVDRVVITVTDDDNSADVHYVLGTASICYLLTAMVLAGVLAALLIGSVQASLTNLASAAAGFLFLAGWMVGGTYFLAWVRAPAWLKSKLA